MDALSVSLANQCRLEELGCGISKCTRGCENFNFTRTKALDWRVLEFIFDSSALMIKSLCFSLSFTSSLLHGPLIRAMMIDIPDLVLRSSRQSRNGASGSD
jgi:hypothetical protein